MNECSFIQRKRQNTYSIFSLCIIHNNYQKYLHILKKKNKDLENQDEYSMSAILDNEDCVCEKVLLAVRLERRSLMDTPAMR